MADARNRDFNVVYVDLDLNVDPAYTTDSDGAVICDNYVYAEVINGTLRPVTPAGSIDYPLSFEQFRKYVETRIDKNEFGTTRTFKIKGSVTKVVDYGAGQQNSGIFNMRYLTEPDEGSSTGYKVVFTNWNDGESYKMKLSATTTANANFNGTYDPSLYFINSGDVRVDINNLDLQTGTFQDTTGTRDIGNIVFINDSGTELHGHWNNKIYMNNCRLLVKGNGYFRLSGTSFVNVNNSVVFSGYSDVSFYNSLVRSATSDSNVSVRDYYVNSNNNFDDDTFDYYFKNSIFLNIAHMYRMVNGDTFNDTVPDVIVDQCVFSEPYSGFQSNIVATNVFRNLFEYIRSGNSNQFGFSIPTLTWDITTLTDDDYKYNQGGWELITIGGDRGSINRYTYGRRDGVGPLYFPEMPSIQISASSVVTNEGDSISFQNSDGSFDSTYLPSSYNWIFPDKEENVTTPNGYIDYVVGFIGIDNILAEVNTRNEWYSTISSIAIRSLIDQNDVDMIINTYKIDPQSSSDTFNIYEDVFVEVVNNTISSGIIDYVRVYIGDDIRSLYGLSEYTFSDGFLTNFSSIGDISIVVVAILTDGSSVYFDKTITLIDTLAKTYYVDLSREYEDSKWIELDYGIFDDFEDGSISINFNSEFRQNYTVERMADELVAVGTDDVIVMRGVKQDDFIVEHSFVRDESDPIPRLSLFMDNDEVAIEWDYISDKLNIYYRDGKFNITVVKYGTFTKDLSCPNSLRKLYVRSEYKYEDGNINELTVYYRLDPNDPWVKTTFSEELEPFSDMSVRVQMDNGSGIGYIGIQANAVDESIFDGSGNGSEESPFTYKEMYDRIKDGGDPLLVEPYYTTFKCRNWRILDKETLSVDRSRHYHIDVWNPDLYGPWMLVFRDMFGVDVNFTGTTLSNGIMYNMSSSSQYDLLITTLFDMWVVWNGSGKIGYIRDKTKYTGDDLRVDIIGSTIKSNNGTYTSTYLNTEEGV